MVAMKYENGSDHLSGDEKQRQQDAGSKKATEKDRKNHDNGETVARN